MTPEVGIDSLCRVRALRFRRIGSSLSLVLVLAGPAVPAAAATGAAARVTGPPAGLTAYGRIVWNLDALLHDRFGRRTVYEDYIGKSRIPDFSTRFISLASSLYYSYTFATARGSAFKTIRTAKPPRIRSYPTYENVPLTVAGAYISCGGGRWLYERNGQVLPGGPMLCASAG